MSLGGTLRFGQWTIPYARLGIGAQGVSYDNPNSSMDVSGLWYFGGGVQHRFGNNFLAGISASFDQLVGTGNPAATAAQILRRLLQLMDVDTSGTAMRR